MASEQVKQPRDRAGRLVLVEAELEVLAHHGEVIAGGCQLQGKWTYPLFLRFEEAEQSLRVAEDVGRTGKAAHGPSHGKNCHFRADRGRSALAVRKLLAVADRAEGHVMRYDEANRRFDLLCGRTEDGSRNRRRR